MKSKNRFQEEVAARLKEALAGAEKAGKKLDKAGVKALEGVIRCRVAKKQIKEEAALVDPIAAAAAKKEEKKDDDKGKKDGCNGKDAKKCGNCCACGPELLVIPTTVVYDHRSSVVNHGDITVGRALPWWFLILALALVAAALVSSFWLITQPMKSSMSSSAATTTVTAPVPAPMPEPSFAERLKACTDETAQITGSSAKDAEAACQKEVLE